MPSHAKQLIQLNVYETSHKNNIINDYAIPRQTQNDDSLYDTSPPFCLIEDYRALDMTNTQTPSKKHIIKLNLVKSPTVT